MTQNIKALVVDDSRLARKELKHLLKNHPQIHVTAEAESAEQAMQCLKQQPVDVLFLDIQMPGMDGFELLQQLDQVPQVIFVTAFDQYALKAFQHNTLDYLQKPIEPNDLQRAIERIETPRPNTQAAKHLTAGDQVFVKDGEQCWFVDVAQIRLLEVDGHYTTIHFDHHQPMLPKTLNHLAERLDPALFFRANRNQLINLKHINQIEPWIQGIRIELSAGEWVELSRRQTQKFKELMSL